MDKLIFEENLEFYRYIGKRQSKLQGTAYFRLVCASRPLCVQSIAWRHMWLK